MAEAAVAFCRATEIETEGLPDSPGERNEQACAELCELLSSTDFHSAVWWSDVGKAWWNLGISEAAKGCITYVRRLAVNDGNANWEDLRRLAEIDLSKQPASAAKRDQTATPIVKAWEDYRAKMTRLWVHFERRWDSENPEHENVLGDPVAAILVFRKMEGDVPIGRWISFWNDHGHSGVAIDHFFATLIGKKFDEFLFSGDYNYWSLFYLSESFRNTRDPVTAYAALLLLSLTLTSGTGANLTSQQKEDRLSQTRERIKDLDWVAPDFHLYATAAPSFALGCQMADWFVANRIPGRFLPFVGKENVGGMAQRSPLFKERFNTMVRNGGWVREFIPDLDETLDQSSSATESAAPFPPSLPAFITQESRPARTRSGQTAWSIRRPKDDSEVTDNDASIELNIGLQNDSSVRALRVRFGQYNPLAIVHSRTRQVLPQLISQLIAQGKRVVWIRDARQDESPAEIGSRSWSWTRRSSNEWANLMTSLGWSPVLQETIVQLMASSTHVAFRENIRTCLDGLLSWIAQNPSYVRPNAQRRRFNQSVEQIRKTGLQLDGPGSFRRLAQMADILKSFLDDLCRAVNCETGYYGDDERAPELAVFDSEGEGRLNTLSLLLFVGGLIGLLRKQHELDFKINARPRSGQPDPANEPTATLEETQAAFKERMERRAEKSEKPSIIDGTVADMCLVVSVASKEAMNSLVEWLSAGSIGAGASLLVALDRLPEAPDFLNKFQTCVVGSLNDQERHRLRVAANLFVPTITDESPAAIVTVAPQLGGLAISSGLLWPQDDRRN